MPDSFARGKITITSVSPKTLKEQAATGVTVKVRVTATLDAPATTVSDPGPVTTGNYVVTVNVGAISSGINISDNTAGSVTLTFAHGDKTKSGTATLLVNLALASDTNLDDEIKATVTASNDDLTNGTATLNVINTSANLGSTATAKDAAGFQVHMVHPQVGKWAKTGANAIKVQVRRKDNIAREWGHFGEVKVELYDDSDDDGKLNDTTGDNVATKDRLLGSITVGNDTELSSLALKAVKTDSLIDTGANGALVVGSTNNIVAYKKGSDYDTLEFRFRITGVAEGEDGNRVRAEGGVADKVYAIATFATADVGGVTSRSIDNRDTETSILQNVYPDIVVGDGKLLKIDALSPDANIITSLTVTLGKTALTADSDNYASIGKWVKIEAKGDALKAFRENSVVFQIIGTAAKTVTGDNDEVVTVVTANQPLVGYGKTFNAGAVLNAKGVLLDSFKVASGQFKRKSTGPAVGDGGNKANITDKIKKDYKKNNLFEDDAVRVRVRAQVKDLAGNARTQIISDVGTSVLFNLDSRPPKITIQYPKPSAPDSARFTEKINQDLDADAFTGNIFGLAGAEHELNPLKFKTDEQIVNIHAVAEADQPDSLYVIIGSGAAADTLLGSSANQDAKTNPLASATYDLSTFEWTNKRTTAPKNTNNAVKDAGQGGKEVDVKVVVKDPAGNKGVGSVKAIFDGTPPTAKDLFPNNEALADYDNKIGDGTQHPIFQVTEKLDSLQVRYEGDSQISVVGTAAQLSMVNENIKVTFTGKDSLRQGEVYDLQVYMKDLAGHVGVSSLEENLTFDNNVNNPDAGGFSFVTSVRNSSGNLKAATQFTEEDSVVAGQAMKVSITAIDTMLSRLAGKDKIRAAVTYSNSVTVVAMMGDEMVSGAKFWGGGVTDNKDGSATLNAAGWGIGKRDFFVLSTKAGAVTLVAKDMNADGVLNFSDEKTITVDAADFAKIMLVAMEDDKETTQIWGDFDLKVVPTDKWGNESLKYYVEAAGGDVTFKKATNTASSNVDSLDILDTRLNKGTAKEGQKYTDVFITLSPSYTLEGLPAQVLVGASGVTLTPEAPDRQGKKLSINARVDVTSLTDDDDKRSKKVRGAAIFDIAPHSGDSGLTLAASATEVSITPGMDSASATVTASGEFEGTTVSFTVDAGDSADDVTSSVKGNVVTVTATDDATVSVTATDGVTTTAAVTITFDKQTRVEYTDSEGNAVYLISDADMTVDTNDFLAFVNAYGSNAGDDNYNLQADVDNDGDVDIDDFLIFVSSYGREAQGAATKPLVLLPGINENAEFSLRLGSERVIPGELVAVDVALTNVEALIGYGFVLNYESDKFEFVSAAPANEDLLKSTGGETPLFKHWAADGQVTIANGIVNGTAVSGGGDIVRFTFRVLREFEENARFEVADGLVFDPQQLQNVAVVAGVLELQSTPMEFALHQNFPNPFNPDTTIKYELAESADVTLQIYNVLGQVVRTLVAAESQVPGRYQIRWNGMDDRGVSVSSGVYFFHLSAEGKFQDVRKLMLLK